MQEQAKAKRDSLIAENKIKNELAKAKRDSISSALKLIREQEKQDRENLVANQKLEREKAKAQRDSTIEAIKKEREDAKNAREDALIKQKLARNNDPELLKKIEEERRIKNQKAESDNLRKKLEKDKLAALKKQNDSTKNAIKAIEKARIENQKQFSAYQKSRIEIRDSIAKESANARKARAKNKEVLKEKEAEIAKEKEVQILPFESSVLAKYVPLLPPQKSSTQLGLQFGAANYFGDLSSFQLDRKGTFKHIGFDKNTFFYGVSVSHFYKEVLGLRLNYTYGNLRSSDQDVFYNNRTSSDAYFNQSKRNLDFKTSISEMALMLECHPLKFINYERKWHQSAVQPYFLVGIGNYKFNPKGTYFDIIENDFVWTPLQPLSTEGQGFAEYPDRKPYKLSQINVPFGVGISYKTGKNSKLSLEYISRILFTDYLDDVSTSYIDPKIYENYFVGEKLEQAIGTTNKSMVVDNKNPFKTGDIRGNAKNNDTYFSLQIKLSIQLNKNKNNPKNIKPKFYKYDDNEKCD